MNNYFSVKELADWCGVSKTTIQRTISELELVPRKVKNKHLYSEEDSQLICQNLNRKPIETESKTADETEQNKTSQTAKNQHKSETNSKHNENHETTRNETDLTKDDFIKFLQNEIEIKNNQIALQSEEIKMLIMTNGKLTQQLEEAIQTPKLVSPVDVETVETIDIPNDNESAKDKWWKFWK